MMNDEIISIAKRICQSYDQAHWWRHNDDLSAWCGAAECEERAAKLDAEINGLVDRLRTGIRDAEAVERERRPWSKRLLKFVGA